MNFAVLANVAVFVLALDWLYRRRKAGASVSSNVLIAVLLGAALGAAARRCTGSATRPSPAR